MEIKWVRQDVELLQYCRLIYCFYSKLASAVKNSVHRATLKKVNKYMTDVHPAIYFCLNQRPCSNSERKLLRFIFSKV